MDQVGIRRDFIVDENAPPYPHGGDYKIQELSAQGYSSLLRIERGRLRKREVFGPLRLHYGFFRLRAEHSNYLIAWNGDHIAGAIGFTLDRCERLVRIFELICLEEQAVRMLLNELEKRCCEEYEMCYVEIDVSAHAPGMQRTLIELGYVPAAYVPAMAFHRVERLDVLKMVRLLIPCDTGPMTLVAPVEDLAELILHGFRRQEMLPRIGELLDSIGLFVGLTEEQVQRLAAACGHATFAAGEQIFGEGDECAETFIVLEGEVEVQLAGHDSPLGHVGPGECLGEVAMLTDSEHSASALAETSVQSAVLQRNDLVELVRQRPDIGVVLYRNLARGLGEKLRRSGRG